MLVRLLSCDRASRSANLGWECKIAISVFTSVRPANADLIAGSVYQPTMEYSSLNTHRDVLQRHQAVHEKEIPDGQSSIRRHKERATEACEACASAKLSCDNQRPCNVCDQLSVTCSKRFADHLAAMSVQTDRVCRPAIETTASEPTRIDIQSTFTNGLPPRNYPWKDEFMRSLCVGSNSRF